MSDVDTGVAGFVGVAGGFGFVSDGAPADLAAVSGGPFVTGVVVDDRGDTVAVVAVVDSDVVDDVLGQLLAAAGVECGGTPESGTPVGSVSEVSGLFTMPTTTTVFTDTTGTVSVVYVTATNRRNTNNPGNPTTAAAAAAGGAGVGGGVPRGLDKLINVALEVSVELGRTRVRLSEVLDYDVGSIIELDRAAGAPVDVRVNDTLLAQGEVVLIDDEYAVRITAIIETHQT